MTAFPAAELARLKTAAALLLEAEDRLPVLKSLGWERAVGDAFLKSGGLPKPTYPAIDPAPSRERTARARALISGSTPVHRWLRRFADITDETAALLSSIGTRAFHAHSVALYGAPSSPIADGKRTALELARRLDALLADLEGGMKLEPPETLSAGEIKDRLDRLLPEQFGEDAPRVDVTMNVSGKAAAGRDYIKLRKDALFSDLDVTQLLQHEAFVHIATAKNGAAQAIFPILAESYPGNARTQEGLAVFAEFISGALDPRRFRRLADRVIAIDMAASGADFIEVFNFFRERGRAAQDGVDPLGRVGGDHHRRSKTGFGVDLPGLHLLVRSDTAEHTPEPDERQHESCGDGASVLRFGKLFGGGCLRVPDVIWWLWRRTPTAARRTSTS